VLDDLEKAVGTAQVTLPAGTSDGYSTAPERMLSGAS